ncbi:MAG: protein-L-isoaspartate(D-aspartate) O-methyltransferase [Proteobacteria bacterium]|nr:protein-L-isoaspartate(D-aspartate) O-methyltransferase [Pseudomonadota bacterium]
MKFSVASQPKYSDYFRARQRMVKEQIIGRGIKDPRVIAAMEQVPRHLFVPETLQGQAYGDSALPIGEGQTISQPFMVAFMTEALMLRGDERVLEIGTGSGYQTAILAKLADRVYSVERIRSLLERARKNFDQVQCRNVMTRLFDGSYGWKEEGPFDAIMVTAGAPSVPPPLLEQLKIGGVLVIPVGDKNSQRLLSVRRKKRGFSEEDLRECSFVALVGEHGWEKPPRKDYGLS